MIKGYVESGGCDGVKCGGVYEEIAVWSEERSGVCAHPKFKHGVWIAKTHVSFPPMIEC